LHSRRTEIESRLKKSYTQLNQAYRLAILDYGSPKGWTFGEPYTKPDAVKFAQTYLTPYLKIAKDCTNSNSSDCNYTHKNLRNNTIDQSDDSAVYYLADGTYFGVTITMQNHVQLFVDCNGDKKPNILGYDIQTYYINATSKNSNNGNIWASSCESDSNCACTKSGNGAGCTRLIMNNNWKIPTEDEYVRLGFPRSDYPYSNL